jgi:hypothetical protein
MKIQALNRHWSMKKEKENEEKKKIRLPQGFRRFDTIDKRDARARLFLLLS